MSLENGGTLGGYNPTSTSWRGGLLNLNSLSVAKSAGRFPDEKHVYPSNVGDHPEYKLSQWTGKSKASGDTFPFNMFVKDDGTRLYLCAGGADTIRQADMSTPFDISTLGAFTAVTMTTPVAFNSPVGISLSPDGTKMFVLNSGTDTIYSYTLTTPWDASTRTYDSKLFSVTTQEATPLGLYVKPDGDKFWVVGTTADSVFEYTMSTPWDLSTAAYSGVSFSVSAQDIAPGSIVWNYDGTYFDVLGTTNDRIYVYQAATPWTVAGASNLAGTEALGDMAIGPGALTETVPSGYYYVPNTRHWYWTGSNSDYIFQMYNRGTNRFFGAIYTTLSTSFVVQANPRGLHFNANGTKAYYSRSNAGIYEVNCPTPFSLTGATTGTNYKSVGSVGATGPVGSFVNRISHDGQYMFTHETTTDYVTQYVLEEAWNPDSARYIGTASFATATIYDLEVSYDGTAIYYVTLGSTVLKRTMSTPWDITTISGASTAFSGISNYLGSSTTLTGLHISLDGSTLYLADSARESVYKFKIATPWDSSSAITFASWTDISGWGVPDISGVAVSHDGTKLLVTDNTNDRIYEFNVRTDTL